MPAKNPAPTRDREATKQRILDAAIAEFAAAGLAGGRMDRIADAAAVNKRMLYLYFGNKEELFDRVVAEALARLIDAVPFVKTDLPAYAGATFDALMDDDSTFRILMWRQLERLSATDDETATYDSSRTELAESTDLPARTGFSPESLIAIMLAMAQTWHITSPALQGALPSRDRLKADIVEAVRRIVDYDQSVP